MNKQEQYLSQIRSIYPDLIIVSARLNDQGQFNDGLIVNGDFIFRFPKLPEALVQLHIEYEILRGIQPYITLPVPDPIVSRMDSTAVGEAFIGYRLIPGELFYREAFLKIKDEGILQDLASQIATFLLELHNVPVGRAISILLPQRDTGLEWGDLYARFHQKLFPHLEAEDRKLITDRFEAYLNDPENFNYRPVLRHGDFGTVNLLYDPSRQAITGVIDFGNAGLGDPALDLAAIMAPFSYGEAFLKRLADHYPMDDKALKRANFYLNTFSLQEALYGVEHGVAAAFYAGIARYRSEEE